MTGIWIAALFGAALLTVLAALFEIAFFASSPIAIRALGDRGEEARAHRERLADPLAVLIPARGGLLMGAAIASVALNRAGFAEGAASLAWAFGVSAAGWFLLREVIPAAVLLRDPEDVLRRLSPWFRAWERISRPLAEPLRRALRRFFPLSPEPDDEATDEEVAAFLETGEEEGILEEDEAEMVRGVLELDETLVREVMTPRPQVVSVDGGASVAAVEAVVAESRHHRIPVFGEGDRVLGIVDCVDLIAVGPHQRRRRATSGIGPLVRQVPVVPETKRVDDLLREFRTTRQTFAVVVDEHASVSGIVTLRDISEEVVGEVHEDAPPPEAGIVPETGGFFLVRGSAELDDVCRATGFELPESLNGAGFDTVSGFVLAAWGRIPAVGETIRREGLRIEVVEADERRVHRVRIGPETGADDDDGER